MVYAEILAGGKGIRMGNTEIPKQFLDIGNKPIIIHTIEAFILNSRVDKIIVVAPLNWIQHTKDLIERYIYNYENIVVCKGGNDRNESIIEGIKYISNSFGINDEDIIITHDAVRPFLTHRIIEENIDMAIKYGATDTVIPAYDTIVESTDMNIITNIPIRNLMYQGQTPQTFNIKKLKELYDSLNENEKDILTDACKIFTTKGHEVKLIFGELFNIKITTPYDLKIANFLLESGLSDK